MTSDIVAFIRARLDEEIARATGCADCTWWGGSNLHCDRHGCFAIGPWDCDLDADNVAHIARHDPARVLREVASKRRVLERHQRYDTRWPDEVDERYAAACAGCATNDGEPYTPNLNDCPELRDLAAIWSDHPDYDQAWTVE